MSPVTVLDVGPLARLVEVDTGHRSRWAAALRADDLAGVVDIVPAARTVLVRCADATGRRGHSWCVDASTHRRRVGRSSRR